MLQQGTDLVIVDLRSRSSLKVAPTKVPGALLIAPEEFETALQSDPSGARGGDVLHLTQRSHQRQDGAATAR